MIEILGAKIDQTSYSGAVSRVREWAESGQSCYICAANVHMLMEAYDDAAFKQVVNQASLVVPDGMPLVWAMRLKGAHDQQRVYGPRLMLDILESACRDNISVGFYGSSPEVLDALVDWAQTRYIGLNIAYSFSPPFREMDSDEDLEIVQGINQSGVHILFVGLGCPKQEIWMSRHYEKTHTVMIGVGAAFDFHAGIKPQAPVWMQKAGLEWLFRLFSEPRRLWRRYFYHNPRFVLLVFADILGLL